MVGGHPLQDLKTVVETMDGVLDAFLAVGVCLFVRSFVRVSVCGSLCACVSRTSPPQGLKLILGRIRGTLKRGPF